MKGLRQSAQIAVLCAASVIVFGRVPESYQAVYTLRLGGNPDGFPRAANLLVSELSRTVPGVGSPASYFLDCETSLGDMALRCRTLSRRRSLAWRLENAFLRDLPESLGRKERSVLAARREEIEESIGLQRVAAAETERLMADAETEGSDAALRERIRPDLKRLREDLSNRLRQRQILEDALDDPDRTEHIEVFRQKVDELDQRISRLRQRIQAAESVLVGSRSGAQGLRAIGERLDKDRAEIVREEERLRRLDSALSSSDSRLADPEAVQVVSQDRHKTFIAVSGWSHTPWALVLGLFLFFAAKGRPPRSAETSDPKALCESTGLPYLGRL